MATTVIEGRDPLGFLAGLGLTASGPARAAAGSSIHEKASPTTDGARVGGWCEVSLPAVLV